MESSHNQSRFSKSGSQELEQLPKRTPKKKGKKTKKGELKQEKQIPQLREELERRWDEFQKRTTILDLLAVIEQDVNKIRFFHSHEEVPIQDQYIFVQVTLEKQSTHELENFYSYSEPEDELKRAYSFRGFSDSSAQSQISWEEARTRYDKIMVLADPGMGKSTLLRMTCLQIATLEKQKLKTDSGSDAPQDAIIPLLLKLDALAASDLEILECVCDIARKEYPKMSERTTKMLRRNLEEGKCLLLLDALDEVRLERLKNLSERLTRFSKNYKCRVICSSRIVGYPGRFFDNSMEVEIVPFDLEKKREYIQAWFKNSKGTIKSKNATAEGLLKELDDKPQVSGLARIPLLLSLICSLYAYGKISLPARRVEIYQQAVDFMLGEWSQTRRPRPKPWIVPKKLLLEKIAYIFSCEGRERFPERDLSRAIDTIRKDLPMVSDLRKTTTVDLIQELSRDDGILTTEESKEGTNYLFLHRTFQEYFAASYINQVMKEDLAAGLKLAQNHFWHLEWHETISLLAGLMDNPTPLLEAILHDERDDIFGTLVRLAGMSIAECKNISHALISETFVRIAHLWVKHDYDHYLTKALMTLASVYTSLFLEMVDHLGRKGILDKRKSVALLALTGSERVTDQLVEALHDGDSEIRYTAAQALGTIGSDRGAEPLIQLLNDESHDHVKIATMKALGRIGNERAVDILIAMLKDEHPTLKSAAKEALAISKSDRAIEPLLEALLDSTVEYHDDTIAALGLICSERTVNLLIQSLHNKDYRYTNIASDVAWALGMAKGEFVVNALIAALNDKDPSVKHYAASALGNIGSERAADALIELLQDETSFVRSSAAYSLGQIRSKQAVDHLIQMLQDEDPHVRFSAVSALGDIASERAVEPLIQLWLDKDYWFRDHVPYSLARIGGQRVIDILCQFLNDPHKRTQRIAIQTLGYVGSEQAVDPLIEVLRDTDYWAKEVAVEALGNIGSERAVDPLIEVLRDTEDSMKEAAVEALGKIGSERAVEPLIEALNDIEDSVKKAAIEALGSIGSERAVEPLAERLKDDHFKWLAAESLKEIGSTKVLGVLISDPDIDINDSVIYELTRTLSMQTMHGKKNAICIYPKTIQKSTTSCKKMNTTSELVVS